MSARIFRVDELELLLRSNVHIGLFDLVIAAQRGELHLKVADIRAIGGPANGPDTIRILLDVDVPLVTGRKEE